MVMREGLQGRLHSAEDVVDMETLGGGEFTGLRNWTGESLDKAL